MASVFSQLYVQLVFVIKNRQALINPSWEDQFFKYITGIVQTRGHKMLAIGGMPDHIHLFIGLKPAESISDLVREIKNASSDYIKQNKLCLTKFEWQPGYGAFSYSRSHIESVCRYIHNQKERHLRRTLEEEFCKIIKDFEVEIEQKKMFDFFLDDPK